MSHERVKAEVKDIQKRVEDARKNWAMMGDSVLGMITLHINITQELREISREFSLDGRFSALNGSKEHRNVLKDVMAASSATAHVIMRAGEAGFYSIEQGGPDNEVTRWTEFNKLRGEPHEGRIAIAAKATTDRVDE